MLLRVVGLATSFFNDKNRSLARDLVNILVESKQRDIPQWLDSLAYDSQQSATGTTASAAAQARRGGGGSIGTTQQRKQYKKFVLAYFS